MLFRINTESLERSFNVSSGTLVQGICQLILLFVSSFRGRYFLDLVKLLNFVTASLPLLPLLHLPCSRLPCLPTTVVKGLYVLLVAADPSIACLVLKTDARPSPEGLGLGRVHLGPV